MSIIEAYKYECYKWDCHGIEMCKYICVPLTMLVVKYEKQTQTHLIFWNIS